MRARESDNSLGRQLLVELWEKSERSATERRSVESANRIAHSKQREQLLCSKGGGGAKFQLGLERGHRGLHGGPVLLPLLVSGDAWDEVFDDALLSSL